MFMVIYTGYFDIWWSFRATVLVGMSEMFNSLFYYIRFISTCLFGLFFSLPNSNILFFHNLNNVTVILHFLPKISKNSGVFWHLCMYVHVCAHSVIFQEASLGNMSGSWLHQSCTQKCITFCSLKDWDESCWEAGYSK